MLLVDKYLCGFCSDRWIQEIVRENKDKLMMEIQEIIDRERMKKTSEYYFPGHMVLFYPSIREYKALRSVLCAVSGASIYAGSFYYYYRPLLRDIETGKSYVLEKAMKVQREYGYMLPTTIGEFEEMRNRMVWAYDNGDEMFFNILANYGEFDLMELQRKHLTRRR